MLDSAYPTSKAYGVTTEKTLRSLLSAGRDFRFICHRPQSTQSLQTSLTFKEEYYRVSIVNKLLRKIAFMSFSWWSRLAWKLSRQITIIENLDRLIRADTNVVWVREQPLPFLQKIYPRLVFVIEIHETPTKHTLRLIKKLKPESFLLCPISQFLASELEHLLQNHKILLSPMGIDTASFSNEELTVQIETRYKTIAAPIRIGYFGKLAPNGISKGFEEILDFSSKLSSNGFLHKILFVGIDEKDRERLSVESRKRCIEILNLEIQSYLPHDLCLELMKNCDVLVLPTNQDPKYSGHPLKAFEYANSARIILCAETATNSQIFSGTFQPYFYIPGDIESMYSAFQFAISDPDLLERLVAGVNFSSKFTWEARTSKILEECEILLN